MFHTGFDPLVRARVAGGAARVMTSRACGLLALLVVLLLVAAASAAPPAAAPPAAAPRPRPCSFQSLPNGTTRVTCPVSPRLGAAPRPRWTRVMRVVGWVGVAEMVGALASAMFGVAPVGVALFAYGCGLVAWVESARARGL